MKEQTFSSSAAQPRSCALSLLASSPVCGSVELSHLPVSKPRGQNRCRRATRAPGQHPWVTAHGPAGARSQALSVPRMPPATGRAPKKKKGTFSDTMKMGGGGRGLPLLLSRFVLGGRLDTAQGHRSFLELQQEPCQVREEGRSQKNRKIYIF